MRNRFAAFMCLTGLCVCMPYTAIGKESDWGEQAIAGALDVLGCSLDEFSLALMVCPLALDGGWSSADACGFDLSKCGAILSLGKTGLQEDAGDLPDIAPPSDDGDEVWAAGVGAGVEEKVDESLDDRLLYVVALETAGKGLDGQTSAPLAGGPDKEYLGQMQAEYVAMGCCDSAASEKCLGSAYAQYVKQEAEGTSGLFAK